MQKKKKKMAPVCPPQRFGEVEEGVYRTNSLHPSNLEFVGQLRLKTFVWLSAKKPVRSVREFCAAQSIRLVRFDSVVALYDDWKPMREELIKEALEIVLDRRTHPVMAGCSSGVHETGTVLACLRRMQYWNLTSILEEMNSFGQCHYESQQYVELFDVDLVTLPAHLPAWFVEQQRTMKIEFDQKHASKIK
jgi:protein tyrosine/serine phosphatase